MARDFIDRFEAEWRDSRPDMDVAEVAGILRAIRLVGALDRELAVIAGRHGLKPGQFNVLAALRRQGRALSPKDLVAASILTSGALTPVLDKLEGAGLVRREADPEDRRGIRVALTELGRVTIDAALDERMARHYRLAEALSPAERATLARLMRKLSLAQEGTAPD